jgi:hypothetical protein
MAATQIAFLREMPLQEEGIFRIFHRKSLDCRTGSLFSLSALSLQATLGKMLALLQGILELGEELRLFFP